MVINQKPNYIAQAIGTRSQDFWIEYVTCRSSEFQVRHFYFLFVISILVISEMNLPLKQLRDYTWSIFHEH